MAIKVLEVVKHSFQKDMVNGAMNGRVTVEKLPQGGYKARLEGQDIEATHQDQQEAIRAVNKQFREKFIQGNHTAQRTV